MKWYNSKKGFNVEFTITAYLLCGVSIIYLLVVYIKRINKYVIGGILNHILDYEYYNTARTIYLSTLHEFILFAIIGVCIDYLLK